MNGTKLRVKAPDEIKRLPFALKGVLAILLLFFVGGTLLNHFNPEGTSSNFVGRLAMLFSSIPIIMIVFSYGYLKSVDYIEYEFDEEHIRQRYLSSVGALMPLFDFSSWLMRIPRGAGLQPGCRSVLTDVYFKDVIKAEMTTVRGVEALSLKFKTSYFVSTYPFSVYVTNKESREYANKILSIINRKTKKRG